MIYETVPENVMRKSGSKKALKLFLKHHSGTFFTARKLAIVAGYEIKGTQVEIRKTISELISEGCPIISSDTGFMWTDDSLKLQKYIESLQHRINGIDRRIFYLKRILEKKNGFIT